MAGYNLLEHCCAIIGNESIGCRYAALFFCVLLKRDSTYSLERLFLAVHSSRHMKSGSPA